MTKAEQVAQLRKLADDLEHYHGLPMPHPDMERAVGVELRALADEIINTED